MSDKQVNFITQQGFAAPTPEGCGILYPALQFQPRVIAVILIAAVLNGSATPFFALAVVLAGSALLPSFNPFEAVYNRFIATAKGRLPLPPAPAPRRFAQALASVLFLTIAVLLRTGRTFLAAAVEAFMFAAIGAVLIGGFCLGSFVFHLLTRSAASTSRA